METTKIEDRPTAAPAQRLLRAEELAEILGLHRVTVRQMQLRGVIPHLRLGSAVRFDLQAVLKTMERNASGVRDAR